jgi:hypothetical protein
MRLEGSDTNQSCATIQRQKARRWPNSSLWLRAVNGVPLSVTCQESASRRSFSLARERRVKGATFTRLTH